jgi:hypothetical protein
MPVAVTIRQDDGNTITIEDGEIAWHVADGVLHVAITGRTKRVRRGRQWTDEPLPPVTRNFPLVHVLEYQVEDASARSGPPG